MELTDPLSLRFRAGLSIAQAAHLLDVDRTTYARWERGASRMPYCARALLSILGGELTPLGLEGVTIARGALWIDGHEVTRDDLRALVFQRLNGMLYCLGEPHRAGCAVRTSLEQKKLFTLALLESAA